MDLTRRARSALAADVDLMAAERARFDFGFALVRFPSALGFRCVRRSQRTREGDVFVHEIDEARFEVVDGDAFAQGVDEGDGVGVAGEIFGVREKRSHEILRVG